MMSNFDKYLAIGPFKFERRHDRAIRVIIHEFLSEKELLLFNLRFRPLLRYEYSRPLITTSNTATGQIAKSSTLFMSKLFYDSELNVMATKDFNITYTKPQNLEQLKSDSNYDNFYLNGTTTTTDLLENVSKRIEMVTTLNNTVDGAATKYRVSLYGLGGMTESHSDVYGVVKGKKMHNDHKYKNDLGDNLATILIWLKNVERGGGTYFSSYRAKQMIKAKAGSALIWINSVASGTSNELQNHGGCPVLLGSKYVLSRWIYQYSQWEKVPCGLHENSPAVLSNWRESLIAGQYSI